MKTITYYNTKYTIRTATAIAECDDENEAARQDVLLVESVADSGELFQHIVFGWAEPETAEDFHDMCDDSSAWESLTDEHHLKITGDEQ